MSITIGNFEIGKLKTGTREKSYWNEDDPRARYNAVSDALWIYRFRRPSSPSGLASWLSCVPASFGGGASPGTARSRPRNALVDCRARPPASRPEARDAPRTVRADSRVSGRSSSESGAILVTATNATGVSKRQEGARRRCQTTK